MNTKVSVIIPVLNAADLLKRVLQSLSEQTYPAELTEIIVVDNGSIDKSVDVARSFGVRLYSQSDKKSPYAARNLGLEHASGSIIALTDANKIPDKRWLEEGVKALEHNNADLAGGQISFELENRATASQVYDAITYNNNRLLVRERNGSAAGNLFFKKELIKKNGKFPDTFRSGMDIWWTAKAVNAGHSIVFAENSIVYCQPRKLKSLLKKSWRVGVLHPVIFQQQGKSLFYILGQTFRTFAPPKVRVLRQKMDGLDYSTSFTKVWAVAWLNKMMMGMGRIRGLTNLSKQIDVPLEQ
ncbi:MAG: glycosyltransferase [Balneolaceae bacterium]|nr:glycosyltransferase [Balneolaceae bacterium]